MKKFLLGVATGMLISGIGFGITYFVEKKKLERALEESDEICDGNITITKVTQPEEDIDIPVNDIFGTEEQVDEVSDETSTKENETNTSIEEGRSKFLESVRRGRESLDKLVSDVEEVAEEISSAKTDGELNDVLHHSMDKLGVKDPFDGKTLDEVIETDSKITFEA